VSEVIFRVNVVVLVLLFYVMAARIHVGSIDVPCMFRRRKWGVHKTVLGVVVRRRLHIAGVFRSPEAGNNAQDGFKFQSNVADDHEEITESNISNGTESRILLIHSFRVPHRILPRKLPGIAILVAAVKTNSVASYEQQPRS
jgi:hypothetical protein